MPALKNLLEGRPLKAPLHAGLVHLPLACLSLGTALDVASRFVSDDSLQLQPAAAWSLAAGVATGLVAALFGLVDFTSIRRDHPAKKWATLHMVLNVVAVILFAVSLYLRRDALDALRTPGGALAATLVGYAVLLVSGYIGGHLVYNDGVAVGRHRRAAPLPDKTVERGGTPGEFVPVCRADALEDGEILRAEVGGVFMAVARSGGRFHAFQEFCTHRFGPLSEGCLRDGSVMCPWHRSCFDLQTGRVTEGPAKVPLRVFETEVRQGEVLVRVPPKDAAA